MPTPQNVRRLNASRRRGCSLFSHNFVSRIPPTRFITPKQSFKIDMFPSVSILRSANSRKLSAAPACPRHWYFAILLLPPPPPSQVPLSDAHSSMDFYSNHFTTLQSVAVERPPDLLYIGSLTQSHPYEASTNVTSHLIAPHGGTLVDLTVSPQRAAEIKAQSRDWPSWDLTPRQLCDLELLVQRRLLAAHRLHGQGRLRIGLRQDAARERHALADADHARRLQGVRRQAQAGR